MKNLPEIELNTRVSLDTAWFYFSDLPYADTNYRDQYYRLKFGEKQETNNEIDLRETKFERFSVSLQDQFTGHIRNGYFVAFGYYINDDTPVSDHQKINKAFFDNWAPGIKIDYESNTVEAYGKKFVDVEILPNLDKLNSDYPDKFKSDDLNLDAPASSSSDPTRQNPKMGRPASEGIEEAISALIKDDPSFLTDPRKVQCDKVRVHIFGDDVCHSNPPKGYRDGAIKSRLRSLAPS